MVSLTINTDALLNAFGLENKAWLIAAPAAAFGVLAISSRVIAGAAALGLKGASKAADYFENKEWSDSFNHAAHVSFDLAKRSIETDLAVALSLTTVAVMAGLVFTSWQAMLTQDTFTKNLTDAANKLSETKEFDWEEFKRITWLEKYNTWSEKFNEWDKKEYEWQEKYNAFIKINVSKDSPAYFALLKESPEYPEYMK